MTKNKSDGCERLGVPKPGNTFTVPNHGTIVATEPITVDGHEAVLARAPNADQDLYRIVDDERSGVRVDYHKPTRDGGREWEKQRRVFEGSELGDCGVAIVGHLVCQNFDAHPDEEVKMLSGPHDGVICPECGRSSGMEVDYLDEPIEETLITDGSGQIGSPREIRPLTAPEWNGLLAETNYVLRVSDGTKEGSWYFWCEDHHEGGQQWLHARRFIWYEDREVSTADLADALEGDVTAQLVVRDGDAVESHTEVTDD